jgi:hypothetical protein
MATVKMETISEKQRALLYALCKELKVSFKRIVLDLLALQDIWLNYEDDLWSASLQIYNDPEFKTVIERLSRIARARR